MSTLPAGNTPATHTEEAAHGFRKTVRSLKLSNEGKELRFVTLSAANIGSTAYADALRVAVDSAEIDTASRIGPEIYGVPPRAKTTATGCATDNSTTCVAAQNPAAQDAPQCERAPAALCPIHFYGTSTEADFADGIQWCEASGVSLQPILFGGKPVGVFYEDEHARYALLGNLLPPAHVGRAEQTQAVFEMMEAALAVAGMDFSHVIRTWFYNDKILDWYDVFNRARDAFFESRGVFSKLVPASTGVGSRNPAGSALMARAFAVLPKSDAVRVQAVTSPLQCSAQDYRSSFSRAVELATPHFRQLIVSGTASIHPGGKSAYEGDIAAQIHLSMQVVEQILASRNMGWADVVRAVVYLKDKIFAKDFRSYLAAHGLAQMPCVLTQSDVCRDELLFEIELDAVRNLAY